MHTKLILVLSLLLTLPFLAQSQPPPLYYSAVDSSSPSALRSTLYTTISGHQRYPYTSSTQTDTWDVLEIADAYDAIHITDVYKNAVYTLGDHVSYNREHTWPNSYGYPNDVVSNYPYTDMHALFLSDAGYNSSRGNTLYRYCSSTCTEKPTEDGTVGIYPGLSNWRQGSGTTGTWEVWSGRQGDVARALLYLDIRYEGGTHAVTGYPEPDLILTDNETLIHTTADNVQVAYMGMLSDLLMWHVADPVDDRERKHNDIVYMYQGNRNPFVDFPLWAGCVYLGLCDSIFSDGFESGDPSAWQANALLDSH